MALFHRATEALVAAGRMPAKREQAAARGRVQAAELADKGMLQSISQVVDENVNCTLEVPSETTPGCFYTVDTLRCTCDCIVAPREGRCKHAHLGEMWAQKQGHDLPTTRLLAAKALVQEGRYKKDNASLVVFDQEMNLVVDGRCTCIAASHDVSPCICLFVAQLLESSDYSNAPRPDVQETIEPQLQPLLQHEPCVSQSSEATHDVLHVGAESEITVDSTCEEAPAKSITKKSVLLTALDDLIAVVESSDETCANLPASLQSLVLKARDQACAAFCRVRRGKPANQRSTSSFPSRLSKKPDYAYADRIDCKKRSAYAPDGAPKRKV